MKSKKNNNAQLVAMMISAIGLMVALLVIIIDADRFSIESEENFVMIMTIASAVLFIGYSILVIRRVNPKQYIYFSYAIENEEIANDIISLLDEELKKKALYRFEILTPKSISYGFDMRKTIQEYIAKSKMVIVIVSESYLKSNWCQEEFTTLINDNKRIIPIVTDSYEQLSRMAIDVSGIKALSIKECLTLGDLRWPIENLAKDIVRQSRN